MSWQPVPDPERVRRWRQARRVLAVRLDNLGDVVMTTPAIAALRQGLSPGARVTLLCSRATSHALPHLPDVDDAIVYDAPWVKGAPGARRPQRHDVAFLQQLAAGAFDAAVIFTVYTQSALPAALMCRLAGIPLRLAHSRENPYDLLTDWVPDPEPASGIRHEVERQLALVRQVGFDTDDPRLRFQVRPLDAFSLDERLNGVGIDAARPLVVVHPGATAASRRYPADRFGLAAQGIAEATGATIVFTGSAAEEPLVREAQAQMRASSVSLAGRLSLGEFAVLIQRARLLVSNNTGPVHLAAALGTPVVDLYALTNPQHTPWQVPARVLHHDVPCRNCLKSVCPEGHHDCLRLVEPSQVVQAALELMDAPSRAGDPAHAPNATFLPAYA
ncbi:MAG TPA: lipopolysaccharide heptosyltransferase II [Burkholderiaceae bacterium]|nr:lipopolysaccharide heptosyltransferase II [Burkholderiaceae bacterium]